MSYGRVMDIIALKTMKMRGQAFVIFEDPAASALALKSLQGFSFFGKPLVGLTEFSFRRELHIPGLSANLTLIFVYFNRRNKKHAQLKNVH